MEWLYNDTAVNIAGIISALSASGFALLALFTDYKKDGKVTKFGRISVAGIALSAMLSVFVTLAKAEISERAGKKARDETLARDAQQRAQFDTQLKALTGVVAAQQIQLDLARQSVEGAKATIKGLTLVSRQQQRSTGVLLQDNWRNANRIGPRSISVQVAGQCLRAKDAAPIQLFREGTLRIALKPDVPGDDPDGDVTENEDAEPLTLISSTMRSRLIPDPSTGSDFQDYEFTDFSGDIAQLGDFERWRGKQVVIYVFAYNEGADRTYASDQNDTFDGMLPFLEDLGDLSKRTELSCIFGVSLEINGITLLQSAGFAFALPASNSELASVIGFSMPARIDNSGIPRVPRGIF